MDRDEAIKASVNGAIAAVISGVLTILIVSFAILSDNQEGLKLWNDPFNFIDIALIFICAYGLMKMSRTAAVVLFVYFIMAKIIIVIEVGKPAGLLVGLIFLYFFAKAIQGTYVFHRIEKLENPEYKTLPRKYFYIGMPVGFIAIFIVTIGIMSMTGVFPNTKVVDGSKVYSSERALLIKNNIISNKDTIRYFYSEGLFSVIEGGNVLTDRKVITYVTDGNNKLSVYELTLEEITTVKLVEKGDFWSPNVYKVSTKDDDAWLKLYLSIEEKGDEKFIKALRDNIKLKKDINYRKLIN